VKVRGMRIDPSDIERALGRLPGIREAAVAVTPAAGGESELTAFLLPATGAPDEDAVRAGLLESLPRTMVPARFVTVAHIPLSPHGKVDRAALAASVATAPPRTGRTA
jgi:acyl-CoA synthetase (AMP-forming)/AMP-acid ligase II